MILEIMSVEIVSFEVVSFEMVSLEAMMGDGSTIVAAPRTASYCRQAGRTRDEEHPYCERDC
ncbi:MAG: hypothetical protein E6J63_20610 [Deltaproteobacteria bacterium]|nr:MAG: hypothetical protein E6J63_20610 [Deltaproteobacteria bacterium]